MALPRLTATIVLVSFAVLRTLYLFFFYGNDWVWGVIFGTCQAKPLVPTETVKFPPTGIHALDFVSCVGSAFFEPMLNRPEALSFVRNFVGLSTVIYAAMAVESQRLRASGVLTWYPLTALLMLLVLFGLIYPVMWVVPYWWIKKQQPTQIGSTKTYAIWVAMTLNLIGSTALCIPRLHLPQTSAGLLNTFGPALVAIFFFPVPQGDLGTSGRGAVTAKALFNPRILMFAFFTGVAALFHFWAVLDFVTTPDASVRDLLIGLFLNRGFENRPGHFIFMDDFMSLVGTMFFIYQSTDVPVGETKGLVQFSVLSVLLGPGAAFGVFLTQREAHYVAQEAAAAAKAA